MPRAPLLGRRRELDTLVELWHRERMVTLTGAGGVGKTRVARQFVVERSPGPVVWVDLAPIDRGSDAAQAITNVIALDGRSGGDPVSALERYFDQAPTLLVIDNCEHLVETFAPLIDHLLGRCEGLSVLATSTRPLAIEGEHCVRIGPLDLPPLDAPPDSWGTDAVELFVDRAERVRAGSASGAGNLRAIARICHRLDGIPLAIELAAARCRSMSPEQIAARLDDDLVLVSGSRPGRPARHRTVTDSIRWTCDLLDESDRRALGDLTVFAGTFDARAAADVVRRVDPPDSLDDVVHRLVEHSLVEVAEDGPAVRYRLLQTIRDFSANEAHDDETAAARARHSAHYLSRVRRLDRDTVAEDLEIGAALDADAHEILAALADAADAGSWDEFGEVVALLSAAWLSTGRAWTCRRLQDQFLDAVDDPSRAHAQVLYAHGSALYATGGDMAAGAASIEAARVMADEVGDRFIAGRAASQLGYLYASVDPVAARAMLERAIESMTASGDKRGVDLAKVSLVLAATSHADFAGAEAVIQSLLDDLGTPSLNGITEWALSVGAFTACQRGHMALALERAERAAALGRQQTTVEVEVLLLFVHRMVATFRGDPSTAADQLQQRIEELSGDGYGLGGIVLALPFAIELHRRGELELAAQHIDDLVETTGQWGLTMMHAIALIRAAHVAHARGDLAGTRQRLERAANPTRLVANDLLEARRLRGLAMLHLSGGDPDRALVEARSALTRVIAIDSRCDLVSTIDVLIAALAAKDRLRDVALLCAISQHLRELDGLHARFEPERSAAVDAERAARAAVSDSEWDTIARAIDQLDRPGLVRQLTRVIGVREREVAGWRALTPAERSVADLIASGLTNAQIATHLHVSRETIKTHVSHILTKLGASNRTQIAAEAIRHTTARRRDAQPK